MMLSVIVPCYNQGKYLTDCISSLRGGLGPGAVQMGLTEGQTFRDFEIVIVDDGSEDNTWPKAMTIAGAAEAVGDVPVMALQLAKNSGTPAAMNAGISVAEGEYVTPIHADDMVEPWYLAQLMQHANPDLFVYGDLRVMSHGLRGAVWALPEWDFERAKEKNLASAAILFSRLAWKKVGGYPVRMKEGREDWAMTLRLAAHGYQGKHIDGEAGYLYRKEGQGRSDGNHTPEWAARFRSQLRAALPEVYGA